MANLADDHAVAALLVWMGLPCMLLHWRVGPSPGPAREWSYSESQVKYEANIQVAAATLLNHCMISSSYPRLDLVFFSCMISAPLNAVNCFYPEFKRSRITTACVRVIHSNRLGVAKYCWLAGSWCWFGVRKNTAGWLSEKPNEQSDKHISQDLPGQSSTVSSLHLVVSSLHVVTPWALYHSPSLPTT